MGWFGKGPSLWQRMTDGLAHVVQLLTNPDYRGLYLERQLLADAGSQDIQFIRSLTSSIERPAEAAEIEIWRELTAGREPKM